MPGVSVTTATRSGPSGPLRAASGQVFMAGLTERGDTVSPVLLRGMADYDRLLGTRVSYGSLYDQVQTFFAEGGSQCYVARVVGPAAAKGTLNLNDRAGSPVATLRVDAQNAGSWSSTMQVEVQNGSILNTFRIIITLNGAIVADETNILNPADAVQRFSKSPFVTVTDLGSATVAPNNNPQVAAPASVTAGSDDRASVAAAGYTTALSLFVNGLGDGAVCIPGQGASVHAGLIAHCKANNRIALLATTRGATSSTLTSLASSLDSEYAGLFAPWVLISDGGNGVRAISPEGYVAACRARAHEAVGPWRAPGGNIAVAKTLLGVDQDFDRATGDVLDNGHVSAIRVVAGSVRLYGWRSLSSDQNNYALLTGRDVLNNLVTVATKRLETYVFETIDSKGQLLSAINASLVGIVEPMRQAGGLYENYDANNKIVDPGYRVETGSSVNTASTLALNTINARLSVRVSPTGALVSLTIVKVGILAGL